MQDELNAIDVSPLDALMGIKAELETLESRLASMEERKESVAAPVFQRVRADYEARRKAMESDAAPLKAAARAEYVKLSALLSRSEADHEAARLDREELDFRHALGEFDKSEYKKKIDVIDGDLAAKAQAREAALALRQRFVDAFRSEEDLEAESPPAKKQEPEAPKAGGSEDSTPPVPSAGADPTEEATLALPAAELATRRLPTLDPSKLDAPKSDMPTMVAKVISKSDTPPPIAPPATPGATQILRAIKPSEIAAAAAAVAGGPPPVPKAASGSSSSTGGSRSGRLVPQNPEAGKLSHTIGAKPLTMGSGESCDIRVAGVTPRHAEVRASMAGITVSDLGGGVRINGIAVEQHLLKHEDVLQIGPARFTFREA